MANMITRLPGWARVMTIALAVFGLLMLLAELQSPDLVLWTGRPVKATESGSIVTYTLNGVGYSFDGHDREASAPPETVVVYVDPHDPAAGVLNKPAARVLEASLVLGPFVLAVAVVLISPWRAAARAAAARRDQDRGVHGAGYRADTLRDIVRRRGGPGR